MQPTEPTPAPSPIVVNIPPAMRVAPGFEFVWTEKLEQGNGSNLSRSSDVLTLTVNRNLSFRKIYAYIFAPVVNGTESRIDATIRILNNKSEVGRLPLQTGNLFALASNSVFNRGAVSAFAANNAGLGILYNPPNRLTFENTNVPIAPLELHADCDLLTVDIEYALATSQYRIFLACLSNRLETHV